MRRDVARPAVTRRCDSNLKPLGGETGPGGETGVHTYFDFYFTRKAGSALKLQMFLEALIAEWNQLGLFLQLLRLRLLIWLLDFRNSLCYYWEKGWLWLNHLLRVLFTTFDFTLIVGQNGLFQNEISKFLFSLNKSITLTEFISPMEILGWMRAWKWQVNRKGSEKRNNWRLLATSRKFSIRELRSHRKPKQRFEFTLRHYIF